MGANLEDQTRPTAGGPPNPIRESSLRQGPSWSPRSLAGVTESPSKGCSGQVPTRRRSRSEPAPWAATSEQSPDCRFPGSHLALGPTQSRLGQDPRNSYRPAQRPASSPTPRGPLPPAPLVKMSAKPDAGFVKEASRQILAGGSAGKVAPPRRGPVAFPFACPENLTQASLPREVSPLNSALRRGSAEPAVGKSKGGRERAVDAGRPRSSPLRPAPPLSGAPPPGSWAGETGEGASRPVAWRRPFCLPGYFTWKDPVALRLPLALSCRSFFVVGAFLFWVIQVLHNSCLPHSVPASGLHRSSPCRGACWVVVVGGLFAPEMGILKFIC